MRKGNLTNWIAVLCLAAAGMPAAAQSPSMLDKVRSLLGQTPAKPAAAVPAPKPALPAPAPAAPATAQTTKPATAGPAQASKAATTSPTPVPAAKQAAVKGMPAPVPPKPAATPVTSLSTRPLAPAVKPVSEPIEPNKPARAESRAASKPAGNSAIKTEAAEPKGVAAKAGLKPVAANSKPAPAAPNSKAAVEPKAEVKAEAPKDVPSELSKAEAVPGIVPVKENINRRDPFAPLLAKEASANGTPLNLPPGKPGLMIGSLHIDGIVNGPNGMIAIVSNPQQRVYFLREGDHLYDGQVEHITMDGIAFHQTGKDPFGNAVEREVAKRLNPTSPGEQQ